MKLTETVNVIVFIFSHCYSHSPVLSLVACTYVICISLGLNAQYSILSDFRLVISCYDDLLSLSW